MFNRRPKRAHARSARFGTLRKYVSPDQIALIYASLGEKDQAFAWLDRAPAQPRT